MKTEQEIVKAIDMYSNMIVKLAYAYVNDVLIEDEGKVLKDGDKIAFANENFRIDIKSFSK